MGRKKKIEETKPPLRAWADLTEGERDDVVIDMLIAGTPLPDVSLALTVSIRELNRRILGLGDDLEQAIAEAEEASRIRARAMVPASIAAARPAMAGPKTWAELVAAKDATLQKEMDDPALTDEERRHLLARLDRQRWKLEAGLRP